MWAEGRILKEEQMVYGAIKYRHSSPREIEGWPDIVSAPQIETD